MPKAALRAFIGVPRRSKLFQDICEFDSGLHWNSFPSSSQNLDRGQINRIRIVRIRSHIAANLCEQEIQAERK
jgi:hypothetical protein